MKIPLTPGGIFFNQHTFIQVHCVHSNTYVTATVNIVSELRLLIRQGKLSLHHTTVPFQLPLSHTLYSYTSHTFPCPSLHTAQGWHTLWPMYSTESHPFLHLMGQGPLMLECLHAPAFHAPYPHGSISVPLLPLPKHCNKGHPDAAAPRCVPLVGSWS